MSKLEIKPLKKSDYRKCIQFAKKGMHFNKYTKNPVGLELYSRYFWYNELISATKIYAAYQNEQLAGVLLLNEFGKQKPAATFFKRVFVEIMEKLVRNFDRANPYDDVNKVMLTDYRKHYKPTAEINYLAADPDNQTKGIGTFLLDQVAQDYDGCEINLYTDTDCSYQFYDYRGFERYREATIRYRRGEKFVPLTCFLYRRKF
ncbi:GNAT family N-acetyltransferase [Companilactobacillus furfuricola]|uniref:GNAT family N-acetyltransferase n=1 Tax=Companilactobacillus furfuricola TaxID=1462575 RepID=UPI000F768E0A|nr:GNAT family N-acetyltransferase [Companilactobacillus furfuricola]